MQREKVAEGKNSGLNESASESTIYKRAVKRGSSSSEDAGAELIDTSDETVNFGLLRVDNDDHEIFLNIDKKDQEIGEAKNAKNERNGGDPEHHNLAMPGQGAVTTSILNKML